LAGRHPCLWTQVGLAGATGPLIDAWIVRNTPPEVRAIVFSTLAQGDAFAQAFGGLFLGAIGSWLSLRAAIVTSAALMLPGIGLLQLMRTSQRDRTPRAFVSMQ
jgi:MFS family permease